MAAFPFGPRALLRFLLPSHIADPLLEEVTDAYQADRARRGRVYAYFSAWREALNVELFRLARRTHGGFRSRSPLLSAVLRDMRYGVRGLRRSPAYSLTVITTIALGVGILTAVWAVVDQVLLSDVDFADRTGQVVSLSWRSNGQEYNAFSAADYIDLKETNRAFGDIHAYSVRSFTVQIGSQARRVIGMTVSAGLLEMIGVQPQQGRLFSDTEDVNGGPRVVVLGYGFWQRELGGRPEVLGQTIAINEVQHEVVGVAPRWLRFRAPGEAGGGLTLRDEVDFFVPNAFPAWRLRVRRAYSYFLLGKLAGTTSFDQAGFEVQAILAEVNQEATVVVRSLKDHLIGYSRRPLVLMAAAAGLVFILSLVNAVNLVIVRGLARGREVAVRLALGSGRLRSLSSVAAESVVLVFCGSIGAIVLAVMLLRFVDVTAYLPTLQDRTFLGSAVSGAIPLGVMACVLLTAVPFLLRRPGGFDGHVGVVGSARYAVADVRWQRFLVVTQLALSVIVLSSAAAITRSVDKMRNVDMGLATKQVLTFSTRAS